MKSLLFRWLLLAFLANPGDRVISQDTARMRTMFQEAKELSDDFDYNGAREKLVTLESMLTYNDSTTNTYKIEIHLLRGWTYQREGWYDQSTSEYETALATAKKYFPFESNQVANAYLAVAWIHNQTFNLPGWKAYLDTAALLFPKVYPPDHCQQGRIWDHRARMNYFSFGPPDTTLYFLNKARHIYLTCKGGYPLELHDLNKNYYDVYVSLRQFDSAEHYLKLQVDFINTQTGPAWEQQRAHTEYSKAHLYRLNGQYEKAISQYHYAKSLFEKFEFDTLPIVGSELYTAMCLLGSGKNEEALKKFYELQQFRFIYSKFTRDMIGLIHEGTARAFAAMGQIDSSIANAEKALFYFHQLIGPDNPKLLTLNRIYGDALSRSNQHFLADSVLAVAYEAANKAFGDDHIMTIRLMLEQANVALRMGNFEKVKIILQRLVDLPKLQQEPELAYLYKIAQAQALIIESTTLNTLDQPKLISILDEAVSRFRDMRNQYMTEESRTRSVITSISSLHELIPALYVEYIKNPTVELFELMVRISETHRGLILSEAVVQSEAYVLAGVPKDLQVKERNLKSELYQVRKKIDQEYTRMSPKKEYINKFFSQQVELQDALDELIQVIRKKYPAYYRAKFAHENVDITKLQDHLKPNEVLVEYLIVGDQLYAFVLSKNEYKLYKTGQAIKLMQDIKIEMQQIASGSKTLQPGALPGFKDYYAKLISPFEEQLEDTTSLIIIPDRSLHYFPFEILPTPENGEAGNVCPFLICRYPVQYQSSILLWLDQEEHRAKPVDHMLTVTPSFQTIDESMAARSDLAPLVFAENESRQIHELWKGRWLVKDKATKYNFMERAEHSDIIHLATHAKADDRSGVYSWLAFSPSTKDSLLYIEEIYGLSLDARMVVLSGCETGIGPLQSGEGLISLSRAFSYAGAESIITSLWPVHDEATSIIMTSFYKHLKEGKSKDKALQLAKVEYLSQVKEPSQMDPYYWAGFIAMGDMAPLEIAKSRINWWILCGMLLVAIVVGFWKWHR